MINCMKSHKLNNWGLMCLYLDPIKGYILKCGYGNMRCRHQNCGHVKLWMDDNRKEQRMYMFKWTTYVHVKKLYG